MSRAFAIIKLARLVALALAAGFFGLSHVFSDLGPEETWPGRLAITLFMFVSVGFIIGCVNPRPWVLGGLSAWGVVLLALFALFTLLGDGPTVETVLGESSSLYVGMPGDHSNLQHPAAGHWDTPLSGFGTAHREAKSDAL